MGGPVMLCRTGRSHRHRQVSQAGVTVTNMRHLHLNKIEVCGQALLTDC
jgi:hypothetical protein